MAKGVNRSSTRVRATIGRAFLAAPRGFRIGPPPRSTYPSGSSGSSPTRCSQLSLRQSLTPSSGPGRFDPSAEISVDLRPIIPSPGSGEPVIPADDPFPVLEVCCDNRPLASEPAGRLRSVGLAATQAAKTLEGIPVPAGRPLRRSWARGRTCEHHAGRRQDAGRCSRHSWASRRYFLSS